MEEYKELLDEISNEIAGSKIPYFLEGTGIKGDGINIDVSFNEWGKIQILSYIGGKKRGYFVKIFLGHSVVEKMWKILSSEREKERVSLENRRLQAEKSVYQMRDLARDASLSDTEKLEKLLATLKV